MTDRRPAAGPAAARRVPPDPPKTAVPPGTPVADPNLDEDGLPGRTDPPEVEAARRGVGTDD